MATATDERYVAERHPVKRKHTGFRLDEAEHRELGEAAERDGIVNSRGKPVRSEMLRRRNAYAALHMPAGWKPEEDE